MIYILLCYHRPFTWFHPCRSYRFSFFLMFHSHFTWHYPWRSSRFYLLRCLHSNFTWGGPWRSSRFSCMSFHPWGLCLLLMLPCGLSMHYLCVSLLWGFSTSRRHSLCLLVYCCSDSLGMMLNNSARFLSSMWCVSLIFAKGEFDVRCFNASTKSQDYSVAASADDTLGIFTFWGEVPWHQQFFLFLFLS